MKTTSFPLVIAALDPGPGNVAPTDSDMDGRGPDAPGPEQPLKSRGEVLRAEREIVRSSWMHLRWPYLLTETISSNGAAPAKEERGKLQLYCAGALRERALDSALVDRILQLEEELDRAKAALVGPPAVVG